jgi:LPS export ABC transporter protein LptC
MRSVADKTRRSNARAALGAFSLCGGGAIVFLLAITVFGCTRTKSENKPIEPNALETAEGFTLTQTVEGKKSWVLKAKLAKSFKDRDVVDIYGAHVEFIDTNGKLFSTLVSDSGIYFLESGDIKALGNVVVTSADSTVLETDSLKWISSEKKIRTEGSVTIDKGSTVITGEGLVSDPGLDDIKIERNFHAETKDTMVQ